MAQAKIRLLPRDWNQKFFFYACGAMCGIVFGDACNLGLERGYASVTGNGGHDSRWGFDGIWAANAPQLQEDFAWRSTHVIAKATVGLQASQMLRGSEERKCRTRARAVRSYMRLVVPESYQPQGWH